MNIAICGCRHDHVYAILNWIKTVPGAQLVAAWEPDAAARAKAESKGIRITHTSLAKMLAEPAVDVVMVCDYFAARGQETLAALRAGKDVLTDKPICTSRKELEEIARTVRATGRHLGCMLDMRDTPGFRTAMELMKREEIGEIHNIVITGAHPLMWGSRPGWYFEEGKHGGTINDIAVHGVDMLRLLTGRRLSAVHGARCWNAFANEAKSFKDCAQFLYELEGGIGVAGDVSYSAPPWANFRMPQYWRTTLWGEKGVMEFAPSNEPVQIIRHDGRPPESILMEFPATNPLMELDKLRRGEANTMEFDGILASAEDTLTIQEYADKMA